MKIAVVGAGGFVGKALCRAIGARPGLELTAVTRGNYNDCRGGDYDVLINTAMPSKRFWALQNPLADFDATVRLTAELVYGWKYSKFVQISTLSARVQADIPYGRNKRAAEALLEGTPGALIVRLAALYGEGLAKSALYDLIHGNPVYVDLKSAYNYLDIDFAARWIIDNLGKAGIREVAARDTIALEEIAREIRPDAKGEGRLENIFSDRVEPGMPSAQEVWKYVREEHARARGKAGA